MRINEIILEQEIDEGLGQAIGKAWGGAMKGVGAVGGGIAGSWDAMKQGYRAGKAAVAGRENPDDADPTITKNQPAGTEPQAGQQAATTQQPPQAGQQAAPAGVASDELDQLKATLGKLNSNQKQELAGELEKAINAPATPAPAATPAATPAPGAAPGGQALDLDQFKKDNAAKAAAGVAGQQQAQQQMKATADANAAKSQQDAAIKAAADAAKAKPPFQQTAADKLAIKAAADKGIREAKEKKKLKKKKVVAEFHSNFLGMII
jgi:hypothetical protein